MIVFTVMGPPATDHRLDLGAHDLINIITALDLAHAAAGGVRTEYDVLRHRVVDAFGADLKAGGF